MQLHSFPFLSKFYAQDTLAMELNATTLKIAHIKTVPPAKKEVANLLSQSLTGLSDSDISKAIAAGMAYLKGKPPGVIDIIPANLVITKNIEVPSINPQEIREIINLQAGRHTPYSREEIIIDYVDIGVYKRNYTKILLIIVARNVIKRHFELLQKAGCKLERVMFAPEGVVRTTSKILKLDNAQAPVSIIHIDENTSDFTVALRHKLLFVRSIPIGLIGLMNEKEKFALKFQEEIKKSIEAYQGENIEKPIGSIVLTGAGVDFPFLEAGLKQALQLPVANLPYFKHLALRKDVLRLTQDTKMSFYNCLACLMSTEEAKVDLVPEEIKLKNLLEQRARDLIKTAVLALGLIVLIFSILMSKVYFKNSYLNVLNKHYKEIATTAKELEDEMAKINLIKSFIASRGFSLEVLTELYNFIPLEIKLIEIKFDEQGKFSLKGTAESMAVVFTFVDNMEKSKYFKEAKTRYTTKRKEGKKDFTDFEIVCLLEKGSGK